MEKKRLAICMGDPQYQERFVNCLMNHYKECYEIHQFTELSLIAEENQGFHLWMVGEEKHEIPKILEHQGEKVMIFKWDESPEGNLQQETENPYFYVWGFQEVYRIMEQADKLTGHTCSTRELEATKRVGVFSLDYPSAQLPYSAMLSSIFGEDKSVLLLNLQPYSGMTGEEGTGIEDLMVAISGESYSRNRILAGIGHKTKWDYVFPAKNVQLLAEGNRNTYEAILESIQKELSYEMVIINFGTLFPGSVELMESCDEFLLLARKGEEKSWREKDFEGEMERRGKRDFLHRIRRIPIPAILGGSQSWEQIAKKWEWNALGDYVRNHLRLENARG